MYSSEYEQEQVDNSNASFYQSNKKLVWIFIAVVLIIIAIFIFKNRTTNSTDNKVVNEPSIVIYPESNITVSPGNTYKLIAIVDNNPNATITWISSDENILKVDDGIVTAIDYGKAIITASYMHSDNKKYDALKEITVAEGKTDVLVTDVTIKDGDLVMPIGGTYQIGLNVVPTDAYIESKVFKSSNESVVSVDNKGMAKAVGYGEATITININNGSFSKELKVFVNENSTNSEIIVNPTKIILSKESKQIKIGERVKLSYTVLPIDAKNSNFIWASSNTNVLSVDNNGIITAISEGHATIKLSSLNGISDSLDIQVIPNVVLITDISLSLNNIYIESGQSQMITPLVIPDTATDKTLLFTSSDEGVIKVQSMNEGRACLLTGILPGVSTLTIKSNTGNITKMVNVTVGASTSNNSGNSSGSSSGGSSCKTTCPDGQYVKSCNCVTCEAGNYCKNGKKQKCSEGYSSTAGASSCTRSSCPAGSYLDLSYSTGCRPCPNGKYCLGATSMPEKCRSGQIVNSTKTGCINCSGISNCDKYGGDGTYCNCVSCKSGYVWDGSKCNRVTESCANRGTVAECNADGKCTWDYTYGCKNK